MRSYTRTHAYARAHKIKRVREKRMKRICGKSALGKAVESEKTEKIFLKNTKKRHKGEKNRKKSKKFQKNFRNLA